MEFPGTEPDPAKATTQYADKFPRSACVVALDADLVQQNVELLRVLLGSGSSEGFEEVAQLGERHCGGANRVMRDVFRIGGGRPFALDRQLQR